MQLGRCAFIFAQAHLKLKTQNDLELIWRGFRRSCLSSSPFSLNMYCRTVFHHHHAAQQLPGGSTMQDSRQPGTKRLLVIASAVAYVVFLGG
jgi:hypothetical protein